MRTKLMRLCLVVLLLVGCGIPADTTGASVRTKNQSVAFVNVNVVPMDSERVLSDQTVLVRGEQIVQVGPARKVKVPAGALRIDGRGKYLMPGLAEMHGHIPPPQAPKEFTEAVLFMYVANGVTTVRGMLGAPGQLELRERANRGELLSPTLYLAGPSFNGNSVNSPAQAIEMVREQKREGWDLLKVHPGLTRAEFDAMAKAAKEVGINFAGHVPAEVGLPHALAMGQETIDHLDGYVEHLGAEEAMVDTAKLAEVVRLTKQAGAWVVPTMVLWETLLGVPDIEQLLVTLGLRYMPAQQIASWEKAHRARQSAPGFDRKKAALIAINRKRILKALHVGGVRIIFGTDAPQQFSVPGFSVHREMALMVDAGMSPYEVLRTATRNAGEYYQQRARFGMVAAGQRADLILVNGNPLKDVGHVARRSGVMVRGRWLSEEEIQQRLESIASANKPKSAS
jgi:imidazolonepropionase-like amidohydrolase